MITAAFEEMNRICPPTKGGLWDGDKFWHGIWKDNGEPDRVFRYPVDAVCDEALRVLWCCWHLQAPIFLNCGTGRYATMRIRSTEPLDDYGKPWVSWVTCRGSLSIADRDEPAVDCLWIGGCNKQTMVPLTNILAIRGICGGEQYQTLYEANEYERPVFRLLDGTKKHELNLFYGNNCVAKGRSTKFAQNWANRFGGTWVDERQATLIHTGRMTQEPVDLTSTGNRVLQLGRRRHGETNSTDRPPGQIDPRYGEGCGSAWPKPGP